MGVAHGQIKVAIHDSNTTATGMTTRPGGVQVTDTETWNNPVGQSVSGLALSDADGSATTATLSYSAGFLKGNEIGWETRSRDWVMMEAWIGLRSTESLTVSNLPADYADGYSVVIYGDSNDANTRTMAYSINDGSETKSDSIADAGFFSGNFTDDKRVLITGLTGTSFTLTGNAGASAARSAVNGFEIIPGVVPVISSFSADDQYVQPGAGVTLSWSVSNPSSLTLDPGGIDVSGTTSLVVNPSVSTTYTLTAGSAIGSDVTEELTVTVGPARPNIIIFLVDDMGITDTSVPFAYGASGQLEEFEFNKFYKTDAMEAMAAKGMKFTQAYATPVCSSTRTSLLTGFNTTRHGVISQVTSSGNDPVTQNPVTASHDAPNNWKRTGVQPDDVMMQHILGDAGYRTIHAGKGHLGSIGEYAQFPTAIGFDVNRGGNHSGSHSYTRYGDLPNMDEFNDAGDFLTLGLTKAMNEEIDDAVSDGVPFFAHMSHYGVHTPFTLDPNATFDYDGMDGNGALPARNTSHQRFATLMEGVDQSLAQITAHLETLGIAEETLIIFLGDNGSDSPATTINGMASGGFSDFPLRGKKATSWEGGIRVPLLISWAKVDPGNPIQANFQIPQGSVEDDLVVVWDILPTVLNITGVTPPHEFDGYDLTPYLKGTPGTHRPEEMLLYLPIDHRHDFFGIYREDNWKLIYFFATDTYTLYDLDTDPTEDTDVAAANPDRVMSMARLMAREFEGTWGIRGRLWPTFDSDSSDDPLATPNLPNVDIDGDGLPDNTEDANGNGLADAGETNPDSSDSDSDGSPDGLEVGTGSDPLDGSSSFVIEVNAVGSDSFDAAWPSLPGTSFLVEGSDDLDEWDDLESNYQASASGNTTSLSLELPDGTDKYFIRITVNP